MAKTYIITRHSIRNYGSVLQAHATQTLLSELGRQTEVIDYRQPGLTDTASGYAPRWQGPTAPLKRVAYFAYRQRAAIRRGRVFEHFVQNSLVMTSARYGSYDALASSSELDSHSSFCVGSDQVWNSEYNEDNRPYYLGFTQSASKFSLASSIGMMRLPATEEQRLTEELSSFRGISVREASAASYLTDLGLSAVQHHVDPTLAISGDTWREFANIPADSTGPYLLVYQLNRNPRLEAYADAIAQDMGLRVRRIDYWPNFRGRGSERIVLPTVEDFVGYFAQASMVVTDSFHGTAFSANLGVPFVVVPPPKYSTRIQSLLELIKLQDRLADSRETAVEIARAKIDTSSVEVILAAERERVRMYLKFVSG